MEVNIEKLWKRHSTNHEKIVIFLGFDKIAENLIDRGALVNVEGQNGMTPLMWAAKKGGILSIWMKF